MRVCVLTTMPNCNSSPQVVKCFPHCARQRQSIKLRVLPSFPALLHPHYFCILHHRHCSVCTAFSFLTMVRASAVVLFLSLSSIVILDPSPHTVLHSQHHSPFLLVSISSIVFFHFLPQAVVLWSMTGLAHRRCSFRSRNTLRIFT